MLAATNTVHRAKPRAHDVSKTSTFTHNTLGTRLFLRQKTPRFFSTWDAKGLKHSTYKCDPSDDMVTFNNDLGRRKEINITMARYI